MVVVIIIAIVVIVVMHTCIDWKEHVHRLYFGV